MASVERLAYSLLANEWRFMKRALAASRFVTLLPVPSFLHLAGPSTNELKRKDTRTKLWIVDSGR